MGFFGLIGSTLLGTALGGIYGFRDPLQKLKLVPFTIRLPENNNEIASLSGGIFGTVGGIIGFCVGLIIW